MESPFFNYNWNQKPRSRYSSPKVVSIPVQFVTSQKSQSQSQSQSQSESSLALKIQKVFKAYLVRKNAKKIVAIKREVDEIEKKLSETETIQLIRKDSKERIRINELLMSLLFKLDSISGVNSVIRDCRKAVIKKAVGLQELVDQIAEAKNSEECEGQNIQYEGNETNAQNLGFVQKSDESLEIENSVDPNVDFFHKSDKSLESEKSIDSNLDLNIKSDQGDGNLVFVVESKDDSVNPIDFNSVSIESSFDGNNKSDMEIENLVDDNLDLAVESEGNTRESIVEDDEHNCVVKEIVEEVCVKGNCKGGSLVEEENADKKRNRELLEKMAMENEKMMSLMSKLCDKSEVQTKMLNSLAQRVENLEKALKFEKIRRKKKRNGD